MLDKNKCQEMNKTGYGDDGFWEWFQVQTEMFSLDVQNI